MAEEALSAKIWGVLDRVKDPCMQAAGLDISLVGLGIIKNVAVDDASVTVTLGLTEPGCGFTHILMTHVEDAIKPLVAPRPLTVAFDWKNAWHEDLMAPEARSVFDAARRRSGPMMARIGLGKAQSVE
jgi:metal-sulfur cluster biosynthetic enzyme